VNSNALIKVAPATGNVDISDLEIIMVNFVKIGQYWRSCKKS